MSAGRELAARIKRLRSILSWRAWTDDEALEVLRWIEQEGFPATATEALVAHARFASEAQELKRTLAKLKRGGGSPETIDETERLLEQAVEQLDLHDAAFYQYAPLFPYVALPEATGRH